MLRPMIPFRLSPVHLTLAAMLALLQPSEAYAGESGGAFLLQWDNDKVVDTDRHYTNGMRIAYSYDKPTGQWATSGDALARHTLFTDRSNLRTGWTLGQDIYTPEDVDRFVPDPLDRPYAGWSYLGLTVQNETPKTSPGIQDTMELDLGVIGPAAHAGQVQNGFHRLINVSVSRGWRSQLNNEAALLATRTHKRRYDFMPVYGFNTDIIGHGTAQLGNVRTGAAIGATVRVGENLPEDFGPVYGSFALPYKRPENLTYSLFAGAEARAVAWDAFLDGNAFRDSADVKKNPYVLEGRIGFSVHYPLSPTGWIKGVRASVNMVHRTREFKAQDKDRKSTRLNSSHITISYAVFCWKKKRRHSSVSQQIDTH